VKPGEVGLLEDPENGIAMLQLERDNSQGAICVYNNGSRVAAGIVPPDILNKLRPVAGAVDIVKAANQLLNPVVPTVPVTPVAARYLTAVIHCKELIAMNSTATSAPRPAASKFAPPTSAPAKKAAAASKATPAASKKSVATGKEKAAAAASPAGRRSKFEDTAAIVVKFKENPYREGTARFTLLNTAAKAGTVAKYLKAAGEPTGGSAARYLALFVKEGHLKVG
jgi:hypothetical protein